MKDQPETLVFRFPLPPNNGNQRGHWRTRHAAHVAFRDACDLLQAGAVLPPPPAQPWQKAVVSASFVTYNAMDVDGSVSRCKHAIDWLVTRGYLVDDKPKHLSWAGMPDQRVSHKNTPELLITLTRVDG